MNENIEREIRTQRGSLVRRLELRLDKPLAVLGLVWLVLLIVELTRGLTPFLQQLGYAIWGIFSEYWPRTPEGRLLCLVLALYGFSIFGYVTATLATFFIGRDTAAEAARTGQLRAEIARLRTELQRRGEGAPTSGRGVE